MIAKTLPRVSETVRKVEEGDSSIMYGSYRGFYKGNIIHSSYEYIMCKIVESEGFEFKTQETTFQLEGRQYTPDIFVYNKGKLREIIEVRGHRLSLEERIKDIEEVLRVHGVMIVLVTEIDLRKMCKEKGLSYHSLKTEWRESKDTEFNKNTESFNPMYGLHHSEKTKKLIGSKAKSRMEDDGYRQNIVNSLIRYNIDTGYAGAKKPRSKRVKLQCAKCGKDFTVTEYHSKTRRFCSILCGSQEGLELARIENEEIIKERRDKIKEIVLKWAMSNKETVRNMQLNKISTFTKSLLDEIENNVGIVDWRTITIATFNTSSRKEFAKMLKEIVK